MNRAWIPAGALAGVSVAGLIALGPLTNSLTQQPVSFPSVVTVSVPQTPPQVRCRSATAAREWSGNIEHAALTRRRSGQAAGQSGDVGQVARRDLEEAAPQASRSDGCAAAGRTRKAAKKKAAKRPTTIGGISGPNSDDGLGRQQRERVDGNGDCRARPAATPPETCRRSGRVGKIRALGAIAQLGERLDRTQEVSGSSPLSSTSSHAGCRSVLRLHPGSR